MLPKRLLPTRRFGGEYSVWVEPRIDENETTVFELSDAVLFENTREDAFEHLYARPSPACKGFDGLEALSEEVILRWLLVEGWADEVVTMSLEGQLCGCVQVVVGHWLLVVERVFPLVGIARIYQGAVFCHGCLWVCLKARRFSFIHSFTNR